MNSNEPVLLGIDIGTSGCTALALSPQGRVLASAGAPYPILSPYPGWAEQRAADWWAAAVECTRECAAALRRDGREIAAIGVDSHLEAFVPVDAQGDVLANGLLWLDQRTVPQAEQIRQQLDEAWVIETTGVPINHVNPAAKLLWLKQNLRAAYEHARVLLAPKDYVNWMLTGVPCTDLTIASKTMLFDLRAQRWNQDICRAIGIDVGKLPPVRGAWELLGRTTAAFAALTGTRQGIPVAAGGGDDHCQALGVGAVEPGIINIGTGTGSCWQTLLTEPKPDPAGRLECHCNVLPDTWIHWAVINATGYTIDWFIRTFGLGAGEEGLARFEALAAQSEPGAAGLFFYPYLWGARTPRLNPQAQGVFFGITPSHGLEQFCRAILEGIAFQFHTLIEWFTRLGAEPRLLSMVGGETRNRLWNQIKADVVGQAIAIPEIEDAAPMGAAMLGALATGLFQTGRQAAAAMVRHRERVEPQGEAQAVYGQVYERYRSVYDTIEPAFRNAPATGTQT